MGSRIIPAGIMKAVITLLVVVQGFLAVPQKGIGPSILKRIITSEYNPCGEDIKPNCVCQSDSTITPTPRSPCPGGREDTDCTCPKGDAFDAEEIKGKIKAAVSPCEEGVEPSCSCKCPDDTTFQPKQKLQDLIGKLSGGGLGGNLRDSLL